MAKRKAAKKPRQTRAQYYRGIKYAPITPAYADLKKIDKIYREARKLNLAHYKALRAKGVPRKRWLAAYHVDHIIPIKGKLVCGLHVETNLRIITALANMKKGNRWKQEDNPV